ncbi:hypothetical protein HK405_010589, partial [Cladochytrium tenue]
LPTFSEPSRIGRSRVLHRTLIYGSGSSTLLATPLARCISYHFQHLCQQHRECSVGYHWFIQTYCARLQTRHQERRLHFSGRTEQMFLTALSLMAGLIFKIHATRRRQPLICIRRTAHRQQWLSRTKWGISAMRRSCPTSETIRTCPSSLHSTRTANAALNSTGGLMLSPLLAQ